MFASLTRYVPLLLSVLTQRSRLRDEQTFEEEGFLSDFHRMAVRRRESSVVRSNVNLPEPVGGLFGETLNLVELPDVARDTQDLATPCLQGCHRFGHGCRRPRRETTRATSRA